MNCRLGEQTNTRQTVGVFLQDKRVTSFLALRGEESKGMLGAVASISDGVASSLGRLLPGPRSPQKAAPQKDTSASAQATPKVTHS